MIFLATVLLALSPAAEAKIITSPISLFCENSVENKTLKIEVTDSNRQTALLTYSSGNNSVAAKSFEAAYSESGFGITFVVYSNGGYLFDALLASDLQSARVPKNGSLLSCHSL